MTFAPTNFLDTPALMTLVVIFCFTSCIAASNVRDTLAVGLGLFGEAGHDDTQPVVSTSHDLFQELDTDVTKYELKCGDTGEHTAFCKALPYQLCCDPMTGKGSGRVKNILCGLSCACKKVSTDTADAQDDTSNQGDSTGTVPPEVANAALVARQTVSDIPQCALSISLPSMMELNCSDTACVCKSEPFIQEQCMEIKKACSHDDAKKAIEVAAAICREAGVLIECPDTPV